MNKGSLASEISKRTGLAPGQVSRVLNATLDVIRERVARGERVVLSGFGTFERRRRNPRTGRNPHTRQAVKIPARNAPVFRPGNAFRELVAVPRRKRTATGRGSRKTRR
ncbi:MAG: HU family DNA-binding protein [Actinomycetota bacterium]